MPPALSTKMKALTYDGPGKTKVVDKPKPQIENPNEAVLRMVRTTICGTDLHIVHGDVPTVEVGRTLGHEGIGVVEEVGSEVKNFKKGDKVVIAAVVACAKCTFCRKGMQDLCKHGGWQLGHLMDGTHAEYFRMPYADTGLYHVPYGVDERGLLVVSDTLPTGLEVGAIRGNVHPGCTVAIVGAGPVGLAAGLTSTLYSPRSITFFDLSHSRLELAKRMLPGASTHTINTSGVKGSDATRDLAKGLFDAEIDGFDVVMEAVGIPATFDVCQNLVGKGGTIANIGVHSTKVDLAIDRLWPRGTTLSMALVSTHTIPRILDLLSVGKLVTAALMVTHDFKFSEVQKAYDVFDRAAETKALKVNIEFE
ncbi:hypothetical protein WHR41_00854 [Cladosporium halotolerans]|uniref:Alcohol dehydrogenase n=1 Tax=Cladosporium halotolerans TaxID=1052096 RepID=A0AB34L550_9PEZI